MIVLGVDPGFSVTGWAIICRQGNKQMLLAHGFLPLPAKKELYERIGIFYEFFTSVKAAKPFALLVWMVQCAGWPGLHGSNFS